MLDDFNDVTGQAVQPDFISQEPEQIIVFCLEEVTVDPMQNAFAVNNLMRGVQIYKVLVNDLFSFRNPPLAILFVTFQLFGCLLNHDVTVAIMAYLEIFKLRSLTAALVLSFVLVVVQPISRNNALQRQADFKQPDFHCLLIRHVSFDRRMSQRQNIPERLGFQEVILKSVSSQNEQVGIFKVRVIHLGGASEIAIRDTVGAFQCAAIEQLFQQFIQIDYAAAGIELNLGKKLLEPFAQNILIITTFDQYNDSRPSVEQQVC
jgi:hypothetical protein